MTRRSRAGLLGGILAALAIAVPVAGAAPTEVSLRIEGPSQTLFEGPVNTGDSLLNGRDGTGTHSCGRPGASPGAALQSSGLDWRGRWNADFQDFFLDGIAGQASVPDELAYWSILVDWRYAAGLCRALIREGDEVLFAFAAGPSPDLLHLTGPVRVETGRDFTVTVRDGWIRGGSGSDGGPVEGATVNGVLTDADGHARINLETAGSHSLKATMPGAVRSNALEVTASGEPPAEPPPQEEPRGSLIRTPAAGERYAVRGSTRVLRGSAEGTASIRLKGIRGRRCAALTTEGTLDSRPCRTRGPLVRTAAENGRWNVRLARSLAPGRYRLAVRSEAGSLVRRFSVAARPRDIRSALHSGTAWLRKVQDRSGSFGLDPGTAESRLATDWAAAALGRSAPKSAAYLLAASRVRRGARVGLSSLIRASLALAPSSRGIDRTRLRTHRRAIAALQRRDGSWGGQTGPTAYALAALRGGGQAAAIARGREWLESQPLAPDADTIGATLWALRRSTATGPAVEALREFQADDGGFAAQIGGAANAQSTALAVLGLRSAGIDPRRLRSGTGISPLDYLRARQRPGGRVDYNLHEGRSSIWVTSQTLLAIAPPDP